VGEKTPTQLGPLERANLNHWIGHLHLKTETDPVSETSCFLKYQTMGKVQKPNNSVCYTPSSKPFRIYLKNLAVAHYEMYAGSFSDTRCGT
jgi:hypothetical protein